MRVRVSALWTLQRAVDDLHTHRLDGGRGRVRGLGPAVVCVRREPVERKQRHLHVLNLPQRASMDRGPPVGVDLQGWGVSNQSWGHQAAWANTGGFSTTLRHWCRGALGVLHVTCTPDCPCIYTNSRSLGFSG